MITIKTKELEKRLGLKLLKTGKSAGLDCASRTGWSLIESKDGETVIDYGFIDIKAKDHSQKFNDIIKIFDQFIKGWNCSVIIEDCFFSRSVSTLKMLARIGMIGYVLCRINGCEVNFLLPTSARAKLGLPSKAKKEVVHRAFQKRLKLGLKDEDAVDAVVLGLCGQIDDKGLDLL